MRLYEFSRGVYVSGSPKVTDLPKLREAGIDAIVCLSTKRTPVEVIEVTKSWYYMPIPDGLRVPVQELDTITQVLVSLVREGKTVLVHCLQGRNRSMLAAALASRELEHWSGQEAFEHARWLRPSSLHNPGFENYLRSLP